MQFHTPSTVPHRTRGTSLPEHRGEAQVPRQEQIQAALTQLNHALVLLRANAELQPVGVQPRLQPYARSAETAMHRLRALGLSQSATASELAQALTVLVLAADMFTQGQIDGHAEGSLMLQRNADRAISCLRMLEDGLR
jgi:hypothetical protein